MKKKYLNAKKVVSQFPLVISICIFPKTVCKLRITNPYFAHCADKGGGGAFVLEDGHLVWYGGNINILGDMAYGNYYRL